jgi:hypothetical protein
MNILKAKNNINAVEVVLADIMAGDKSVTEVAIIVQGMELVGKKETAAAPGSSNELKKEELYEIIWAEKQNL